MQKKNPLMDTETHFLLVRITTSLNALRDKGYSFQDGPSGPLVTNGTTDLEFIQDWDTKEWYFEEAS